MIVKTFSKNKNLNLWNLGERKVARNSKILNDIEIYLSGL